jgi:hypothetical protein
VISESWAHAVEWPVTFPGRLVLGLGSGYPQQATAVGREFGRPLEAMRDYLERMTAPTMTLVSEIVAHGDPGSIAAVAAAHLAAGADHVVLLPPSSASMTDLMTGVAQLERLAPAVLPLRRAVT